MAGITQAEREHRDWLYERGLKNCSSCSIDKPLAEFGARSDGYRGLYARCKRCVNTETAAYQKRRPQVLANRQKRWRQTNPTQWAGIAKRYRDTHPLEERLRSGRLRAEQRGVPAHDITAEELLADWQRRGIDPDRCIYTGQQLQRGWNLDHAVPLSAPGTPGHVVENLVPCDHGTNASKGRRHWVDYLADRAESALSTASAS